MTPAQEKVEISKMLWGDVAKALTALELRLSSYHAPKGVLAIGRGGWVTGSHLACRYDVPLALCEFKRSYVEKERKWQCRCIDWPKILPPVPFLVVDDVADSGATLRTVMDLLVKKFGLDAHDDLLTVALVKKPLAKPAPDVYGIETKEWIVFPWEPECSMLL